MDEKKIIDLKKKFTEAIKKSDKGLVYQINEGYCEFEYQMIGKPREVPITKLRN